MKLAIRDFKGEIPRRSPILLPPGFATRAENVRLEDGNLAPRRLPSLAHTLPAARTFFFRHQGVWYGEPNDVSVAQGPVLTDRLYITRPGSLPQMLTGPNNEVPLKLNPPPSGPLITLNGSPVLDDQGRPNPPLETIFYAYTYVTPFDEESAPSPLSNALDWQSGLTVDVQNMDVSGPGRIIDRIRLYRSQTTSLGNTDLFFVKEFPVATATFTHDLSVDPMVELIPSTDFDRPPDNMRGITAMPNGMMAAFEGKRLLFCEPFIPHAWPEKYELKTDYEIVGLAAFGSTLAVMTTGTPYIVQGTKPETMIMQQIEHDLPCRSASSIVDMGYAAVYAGDRGLVMISQNNVEVITRSLFTREQWQSLRPDTVRAERFDGRYVFSADGGGRATRILDLTGEQPYLISSDIVVRSFWHDRSTGDLYYISGNGLTIQRFEDYDRPYASIDWQSGVAQMTFPASFSAGLVQAEPLGQPAAFTLEVYADGVLLHTETQTNKVFRLPAKRANEWFVRVQGNMNVSSVTLAGSVEELMAA